MRNGSRLILLNLAGLSNTLLIIVYGELRDVYSIQVYFLGPPWVYRGLLGHPTNWRGCSILTCSVESSPC
jgi:hypothetical protein